MSDAQIHIASVVVWLARGGLAEALSRVRRLHACECHAEPGVDKLVIVMEARSSAEILECITHIESWPGVTGVQLVYQHAETEAALNKEIAHETDPA